MAGEEAEWSGAAIYCTYSTTSRSSDRLIAFGYSSDGRWTACVYEMVDDDTILPITAYYPGTE